MELGGRNERFRDRLLFIACGRLWSFAVTIKFTQSSLLLCSLRWLMNPLIGSQFLEFPPPYTMLPTTDPSSLFPRKPCNPPTGDEKWLVVIHLERGRKINSTQHDFMHSRTPQTWNPKENKKIIRVTGGIRVNCCRVSGVLLCYKSLVCWR